MYFGIVNPKMSLCLINLSKSVRHINNSKLKMLCRFFYILWIIYTKVDLFLLKRGSKSLVTTLVDFYRL